VAHIEDRRYDTVIVDGKPEQVPKPGFRKGLMGELAPVTTAVVPETTACSGRASPYRRRSTRDKSARDLAGLIRATVDKAPPLTAEQRADLAALLQAPSR
jgi:hypothetical protein